MTYTFELTDSADHTAAQKEAGITAARARYNADNADVEGFVPLADNAAYVSFVMNMAAESYARQYNV